MADLVVPKCQCSTGRLSRHGSDYGGYRQRFDRPEDLERSSRGLCQRLDSVDPGMPGAARFQSSNDLLSVPCINGTSCFRSLLASSLVNSGNSAAAAFLPLESGTVPGRA